MARRRREVLSLLFTLQTLYRRKRYIILLFKRRPTFYAENQCKMQKKNNTYTPDTRAFLIIISTYKSLYGFVVHPTNCAFAKIWRRRRIFFFLFFCLFFSSSPLRYGQTRRTVRSDRKLFGIFCGNNLIFETFFFHTATDASERNHKTTDYIIIKLTLYSLRCVYNNDPYYRGLKS